MYTVQAGASRGAERGWGNFERNIFFGYGTSGFWKGSDDTFPNFGGTFWLFGALN